MNEEEFERYKKDRYQKETAWYDKKAIQNHHRYNLFQWATVILAALTPVLILIGDVLTKWPAAGVAVAVAICTGALKAFKYQENWINYRTTCETLKKEVHFYEADTAGYDKVEDKMSLFVERVEALISRENTLWSTTQARKEEKKYK